MQKTSISDAFEETFISKIKVDQGNQHVSKYIQMRQDINQSVEFTTTFKNQVHKGVVKGIELAVKILTAGLWKFPQNEACVLPADLNACVIVMTDYYKQQHVGKNLTCAAHLGDCEVLSKIYSKPYSFTLTTYQTAILMQFNEKDCYTFQELLDLTKLPKEAMIVQIYNLISPKYGKLLIKENIKSPKIEQTEKIKLNTAYNSSSLRANLMPIAQHKV